MATFTTFRQNTALFSRKTREMVLTGERLEMILERMPEARIGVIGDFCLDVYWVLDMSASEVSVETGRETQPVRTQRYSLGGAGNVVANLAALGVGGISCFGAVGDDPFGHCMLRLLEAQGCDASGMWVSPDADAWQTSAYCKPYVGNSELPRIDCGNFNALPESRADALVDALEESLPALDLVIVNQQVISGIHTERLRTRLAEKMRAHADCTFIYDGRQYADSYPDAWLKINASEAVRLCGGTCDPGDPVLRQDAVEAARKLAERTGKPVFVTRGDRGCIMADRAGVADVPGIEVIGAVDPVGAGDSFLAGLAAGLAAGASRAEAMEIGNVAARVTVTKLQQTGTASPDEMLAVGRAPHYIYLPEIADDPRQAQTHGQTDIEIVRDMPTRLAIQCAIFDHDGTISTLRQGWEEVMEPMMVRAVLGDHFDHADEAVYRKVVDQVRRFIDQTTGVQTLVQMQGLVELVRRMGFVPEEEILDMHGYKTIYNEALMTRVRDRLHRLERGELGVQDFTIKNAVAFLHALRASGITCYLASGTDEADVCGEAEALGYADAFDGGIYGAAGDVTHDAKQIVLERILARIGSVEGRLVTFGDGPVEMRETHRRGGLAVGVASDEVRRFGLNPAKRARLIRAGASLIVPDFSQMDDLLGFLGVH